MLAGIETVNKCLKTAQLCQLVGPKHTEKIGKNGQEKKKQKTGKFTFPTLSQNSKRFFADKTCSYGGWSAQKDSQISV